MWASPTLLRAVAANAQRQKSISFIGLGRMGSEMAYNLFSRTLVESNGGVRFVVCDAREATSVAFAKNFTTQFPGANIQIANTPAEYVEIVQLSGAAQLPWNPRWTRSTYLGA